MQPHSLTKNTGQILAGSLFVSGWAGYPCLFPDFSKHARFIHPFGREVDQNLSSILDRTWKTIFAWSLGAHLCLKYLDKLRADRLVLIAPFLDFCQGTPQKKIEEMLRGLEKNPQATVRWFWKACAVSQPPKPVISDVNMLRKGLEFLIHSRVDHKSLNTDLSITLIHGLKDRIVPLSHSEHIRDCLPQACCQYLPHGHYIPEPEILNAIR
ncbi:MAG: hypothetical protein R6X11_09925 [Desulfonatronovibrio sp.]